MRTLAEESGRAAAEIETLIAEMQGQTRQVVGVVCAGSARTEEGVATVEQTREAFVRIDAAVEGVGNQIAEIASAVERISASSALAAGEVATVAEQSSASAQQVSASTQETSASTQEIAASAADLARTADELDALVRRFKVRV